MAVLIFNCRIKFETVSPKKKIFKYFDYDTVVI